MMMVTHIHNIICITVRELRGRETNDDDDQKITDLPLFPLVYRDPRALAAPIVCVDALGGVQGGGGRSRLQTTLTDNQDERLFLLFNFGYIAFGSSSGHHDSQLIQTSAAYLPIQERPALFFWLLRLLAAMSRPEFTSISFCSIHRPIQGKVLGWGGVFTEKKRGEQKRKANDSDTNFYLMDLRLVGDVPLFLSNSVECCAHLASYTTSSLSLSLFLLDGFLSIDIRRCSSYSR